jgi:RNA polymerase sigma-70 factor (ECF subfamily)
MTFDADFLTRLKQRDPDTCTFLVSSLTPVLEARLRYKLRDYGAIEDIRNETFYRVFRLVDRGRVREPEQFGSFVRGVCDRVAQESRRKARTTEPLPRAGIEPPDCQPHLDKLLVEKERRTMVWREVMKLSEADRRLIVETHGEERDRRQMARDRGISTIGLNVRLCRAMKRLRAQVLQQEPAVQPACRPRARGARTLARRVPTHGDACSPNRWATMAA